MKKLFTNKRLSAYEAISEAQRAVELDPVSGFSNTALGQAYFFSRQFKHAIREFRKAIALDKDYPIGYLALSWAYRFSREHENAIASAKKAMALNPNNGIVYVALGRSFVLAGKPEEAIPVFKNGLRIDPLAPYLNLVNLGEVNRMMGRYEEAISYSKKALQGRPNGRTPRLNLMASLAALGRDEEARAEVEEYLKIDPDFSLEKFAEAENLQHKKEDTARYIELLRKAGLP